MMELTFGERRCTGITGTNSRRQRLSTNTLSTKIGLEMYIGVELELTAKMVIVFFKRILYLILFSQPSF